MRRRRITRAELHDLQRRHVLSYRWVYIATGCVFLASLGLLTYLSNSYHAEAETLQDQVEILSEQRALTQTISAVATEYWSPDSETDELDARLEEAVGRFKILTAKLHMLSTESDARSYFSEDMQDSLSSLMNSWAAAQFELGLDSRYVDEEEPPARLGEVRSILALRRVQTAFGQLLRDVNDLMSDTDKAHDTNHVNRSRLMSVFIGCLLVCGLLMMWFLWSATFNRMEILALNKELEQRVEERAGELHHINMHLSNVQSAICSALIVTDPQDKVMTWNPAAERLWGISRKRAEGQDIFSIPGIGSLDEFKDAFEKVRTSAQTARLTEFAILDSMNYQRICNATVVPLLDQTARSVGVVILIDDVTETFNAREELARSAEQIAKTNDLLTRVNNDLEQIVYAASHDLRSPLVNLRGLTHKLEKSCEQAGEILSHQVRDEACDDLQTVNELLSHDIPKTVSRVNNSVNKFGAIIDGLLQFSRTGREDYAKTHVDMEQEVASVVALFASMIEELDVQIFVADLPPAHCNRNAVNKVLANLLDNALNYLSSERPGEIVIEGERLENNMCRYYVRDNGIGISPKALPQIFKIFHRAHGDHCPGDGLGLAIARKIVERHGGKISVESEESSGTTFWFTIPASEPVLQQVTV